MKNREVSRIGRHTAHNYDPLPVTLVSGLGSWVFDTAGKRYLDCLSCYSALNFGHNHPRLVRTVEEQMKKISVTSRAVGSDNLDAFCEALAKFSSLDQILPMNTGAEAVETAIKIARKWGYIVKGVKRDYAHIIVCRNNFHGRTTTIVGFSTVDQYYEKFGPYGMGFKIIKFNNAHDLSSAITDSVVGFLVEPIQGEAGVVIPDRDYLQRVREICTQRNALLMLDEVQTGFGRTGYDLAHYRDDIRPDIVMLGKALGGGLLPVSAVAATDAVMNVINPGDHGSTFGGNPLACAVGLEAIQMMRDYSLSSRSLGMGSDILDYLKKSLRNGRIRDIRGRGLMIGIELDSKENVESTALRLLDEGVIVGRTRNVLRINPPLTLGIDDSIFLMDKLERVFNS